MSIQCFGYFINPWSRHLRSSVELLRRSFTTAQETGDLKYAVYACDRLVTILLAVGDPLGDVQREAENGLEFARKAKFGYVVDIIAGQLALIRTLRGLTSSFPPSTMRSSMRGGSSGTWRATRIWYSPGAGIGSGNCRRASCRRLCVRRCGGIEGRAASADAAVHGN